MTSWFSRSRRRRRAPRTRTTAEPPKPKPKPSAKPRAKAKRAPRARAARSSWIVVSAILLAGVVFVNLAVLRLNLELDSATQRAHEAPRRERRALVAALAAARLAADPVARAPAGRPRRRRPGDHRLHRPGPLTCEPRTSRRTAGSASCSASSSSSSRRRSRARRGSRSSAAAHYASLRAEPAPRDAEDRRPAAARSSTAPASQLAIGEQTTTVFADPQQVRNPRAVARAAHDILGVDGERALPAAARTSSTRFVYVQRFADPAEALHAAEARPRRPRLLSGGAARRTRRARSARR